MKKLKQVSLQHIPTGTEIDVRLAIDTIDLDFYSIGDYIEVNNLFYKVICK